MRKIYKLKEASIVGDSGIHGRSTVDIQCPFCKNVTQDFIWSISASGKKCDWCDTILHLRGNSWLLFPKLTNNQENFLSFIRVKGLPENVLSLSYKRVIRPLIEKGYIVRDGGLNCGYSVTSMGVEYCDGDGFGIKCQGE